MNAAGSDLVRWSARRWIYTCFAVALLQTGLILYLGESASIPMPVPRFQTSIQLAADPWSEKQLSDLPELSDPTLFALPNPRSFSGPAWFTFSPVEHRVSDWTEPPRWLDLDTNRLGGDFASVAAKRESSPMLIADKPMPPLAGIENYAPPPPVRTNSRLRFEGDLAARELAQPIQPPDWEHSDILTNSVVQAIVDARGFTLSAVLLISSGLREADQFALKTATQARFEPLPRRPGEKRDQLSFGRCVFEWHTVPKASAAVPAPAP